MTSQNDRRGRASSRRPSGPSPALIAAALIGFIVLAAIVTLALVGGGKKPTQAPTTQPEQVDPFEGLGPDPLRQKK